MDDITSRETEKQFKWVGTRPVRPDGVPKVTGVAQYGADLATTADGVATLLGNGLHLHPARASLEHIQPQSGNQAR